MGAVCALLQMAASSAPKENSEQRVAPANGFQGYFTLKMLTASKRASRILHALCCAGGGANGAEG